MTDKGTATQLLFFFFSLGGLNSDINLDLNKEGFTKHPGSFYLPKSSLPGN